MSSDYRLILYHKHSSSGRTLFLYLNETVCQFDGISAASRVLESHVGGNQVKDEVKDHFSNLLVEAEKRLELSSHTLEIDPEFNVLVDDSGTPIQVYLAKFTSIEPPEDKIEGGKFIALTDARRLRSTELELLRLAYSAIMDDLS